MFSSYIRFYKGESLARSSEILFLSRTLHQQESKIDQLTRCTMIQKLKFRFEKNRKPITAEWIWDSSEFYLNKPKLDIGLFDDLPEFPCFYQFLYDVIIKLFCFDLQNNFTRTGKNREIQLDQPTIRCQVLGSLNKMWSCLIFIKL